MQECKDILTADAIRAAIEALALEVREAHGDCHDLAIIGVQRRGVDLARRLKTVLDAWTHGDIPLGQLDINLYRDDWTSLAVQPTISQTDIPFPVDGRELLLVDDVLFTGRTVRAALEALLDFGRPKRVELLVLVDRGHRELPIHADYVGEQAVTRRGEHINVYLTERDGEDRVCLVA